MTRTRIMMAVSIAAVLMGTLLLSIPHNAFAADNFIDSVVSAGSFGNPAFPITSGAANAGAVIGPNDANFIQLSLGSSIVMKFDDNVAYRDCSAAPDLRIWTFDKLYLAKADVFVSNDGSSWVQVGSNIPDTNGDVITNDNYADINLDVAGVPASISYVMLTTTYEDPAYPEYAGLGFDLDAVQALVPNDPHCVKISPVISTTSSATGAVNLPVSVSDTATVGGTGGTGEGTVTFTLVDSSNNPVWTDGPYPLSNGVAASGATGSSLSFGTTYCWNVGFSAASGSVYLSSGATGADDPTNECFTTGQTGSTGPTGPTVPQCGDDDKDHTGHTGATGQTGRTGHDEDHTGATGQTGHDDDKDRTGATGSTGHDNDCGHTGHTGKTGQTGKDDDHDHTGQTGSTGKDDDHGHDGKTGATGYTGKDNDKGRDGKTGATGSSGKDDDKGHNGNTGNTGSTGKKKDH